MVSTMDQLRLSGPARPGDVLGGRYRLEELIGEGGMGSVWRASDRTLERTVAVKVFWVRAAEESDARRRESEKRLLAAVSHPSLVTLFDAHLSDDAVSFLVMEHINGGTLASVIDRGPIGLRDAASLATDLGEALHVVHRAGIIHRDVKPANILLRPPLTPDHTFRAVLADFGIAHVIDGTRMTTPGLAMGTAAYISPEQVRGLAPTPASDIYSLGLVLLEALSGRRAFSARTPIEAISARLTASPSIPGQWGYGWRSLLTAMTALDPDARPTAVEVASRARVLDAAPADPALTMPIGVAAPDVDTAERQGADEPTRALPAVPTRVAASAAVGQSEPESRRSAREAIIGARRRRRRRGRVVGAVALTAAAAVIALTVWIGASVPDPSPTPLPQLERPVNSSSEDVSVPTTDPEPATEPVVEPAPGQEPVVPGVNATDPVPGGTSGNQNAGPGNNSGNGNGNGNANGAGKGKGG
jgi:serine/threonine protein kinase